MRTIVRALTLLTVLLSCSTTFAQNARQGWLVDTLYKSGKINAVVAVVAVLLSGLAIWLFVTDRRLSRLERELNKR